MVDGLQDLKSEKHLLSVSNSNRTSCMEFRVLQEPEHTAGKESDGCSAAAGRLHICHTPTSGPRRQCGRVQSALIRSSHDSEYLSSPSPISSDTNSDFVLCIMRQKETSIGSAQVHQRLKTCERRTELNFLSEILTHTCQMFPTSETCRS